MEPQNVISRTVYLLGKKCEQLLEQVIKEEDSGHHRNKDPHKELGEKCNQTTNDPRKHNESE